MIKRSSIIVFRALSDPSRMKIIDFLTRRDCVCICELAKLLKKDQSVAFRHVHVLKSAGLLNTHKEGKFLFCCLRDKAKIRKLLEVV